MHDRAARPTGAVKSAAAIAIEIMILLNIDLRIAHVRPRVEESVQRFPVLLVFLLCSGSAIMFTVMRIRCFRSLLATALSVNCESFRGCDQYVSCHYGEQRKPFVRKEL